MANKVKTIEEQIASRIHRKGKGWVFTPSHFLDLGIRATIDTALRRLRQAGTIRRLARGLYDYPESHAKLGLLSPSPDAVAHAIGESESIRLQPSGAYAVNLLGLSQQVPAQIVYLTDGSERDIEIGKQQIRLRRTTPKNMATAGTAAGLVIQAFRYLGKDGVSPEHVDTLRRTLTPADREKLWKDRIHAPAWMHQHFAEIGGEKEED